MRLNYNLSAAFAFFGDPSILSNVEGWAWGGGGSCMMKDKGSRQFVSKKSVGLAKREQRDINLMVSIQSIGLRPFQLREQRKANVAKEPRFVF